MARRKRKRYKSRDFDSGLSSEAKRTIGIVLLFIVALVGFLSLLDLAGDVGFYVIRLMEILFGWGHFLFPILLIIWAYLLINSEKYELSYHNYLGLILLVLSYSGLLHIFADQPGFRDVLDERIGGGAVGFVLGYALETAAGFWVALILLIGFFLISLAIIFNSSLSGLLERIKGIIFWRRGDTKEESEDEEDDDEDEEEQEDEPEFENKKLKTHLSFAGKKEDSTISAGLKKTNLKIQIPLDLLESNNSKPTSGDIKANKEKIQNTLSNFGIEVEMRENKVGPTITQYTLRPSNGVKLSKILALNNDLSLNLAAHPIRIEAPIPGKSLVGIEVPNQSVAVVKIKDILLSEEFKNRESNLTFTLGKDVSGKAWVADLTKMPHLLIAGATGSGKSVCINSLLISLLYTNSPDDLKLILVDPKRVELSSYNNIPYLLTPVITDAKKTVNSLKWAVNEMDRRYKVLSQARKRNIQSYNDKPDAEKMPYIVIIIDELADLMSVAARDVEALIIRLAQMARAVGIHLVLATQRPSVNVITGLIKANITSRIAFSVASLMDSRTILDTSGAEKLLGRGDMLYISSDLSKPKRIQGVLVSDEEIEKVTDFLKDEAEPVYNEEVVAGASRGSGGGGGTNLFGPDEDDLLPEARELIINSKKASASFLQRKFRIGYSRAARLLDLLEEEGIIGPPEGSRPRSVLVNSLDDLNEVGALEPEDEIENDDSVTEKIKESQDKEKKDKDFIY